MGQRNGITQLKTTDLKSLAYTRTQTKLGANYKHFEDFDSRFVSTQKQNGKLADSFGTLKKEFFATK